ncbi:MAG: hypothetical protein OXU45_09185 [Candidatus Melainabacteria bacterium]|nr:hypothetical protein [Candidatus Melainabacteria bacterium]
MSLLGPQHDPLVRPSADQQALDPARLESPQSLADDREIDLAGLGSVTAEYANAREQQGGPGGLANADTGAAEDGSIDLPQVADLGVGE